MSDHISQQLGHDRVSDALDRLTNEKFETRAQVVLVLECWDGMAEHLKTDQTMVDAIENLRRLVT